MYIYIYVYIYIYLCIYIYIHDILAFLTHTPCILSLLLQQFWNPALSHWPCRMCASCGTAVDTPDLPAALFLSFIKWLTLQERYLVC